MISLTNAFGGLSAADLSQLFGVNAPSSSNPTSTTIPQLVTNGGFMSGGDTAAKAIQAIVRAQIEKAPSATQKSVSVIEADMHAAYAAQMSDGTTTQTLDAQSETDYSTQVSDGTTTTTIEAHKSEYESYSGGVRFTATTGFSSVSSDATSDATQSQWADSFEMGISLGSVSLDIKFGAAGLDHVTAEPGRGLVVGQGNITENFQLNVENEGGSVGENMAISGLDEAQAQKLVDAFNNAAASLAKGLSGTSGLYFSTVASDHQFTPHVWMS